MTNNYVKILFSVAMFVIISTMVLSAIIYFIPLGFVFSDNTDVPLDEARYISDYSCAPSCDRVNVTSQNGIHEPDNLLFDHESFLRTKDYGKVQRIISTQNTNKNTTIKWTDKRASIQTTSKVNWYYDGSNLHVNNDTIEQNSNNRLWGHRINKQLYEDEFSTITARENRVFFSKSSYIVTGTQNTDFEKRIERKLDQNNFTAIAAKKNTEHTYSEHIVTYEATNETSETVTKISVKISSRRYIRQYTETVVEKDSGHTVAEYIYKFDRDNVSILEPVWV